MPLFNNSQSSAVLTTGNQSISGIKTFIDTTGSSGISTGAVVVSGGLGVGGSINAGGSFITHNLMGNVTLGYNSNSVHSLLGNVTLGYNSNSTLSLLGNATIGYNSNSTLSLTANVTIGVGSSTVHTVLGSLSISKPLTTSGRICKLQIKAANYTSINTDEFILVNASTGAKTITLLAASTAGSGATITVMKTDASANAVTVTSVLSGGILSTQYASGNYVSDGTSWYSY